MYNFELKPECKQMPPEPPMPKPLIVRETFWGVTVIDPNNKNGTTGVKRKRKRKSSDNNMRIKECPKIFNSFIAVTPDSPFLDEWIEFYSVHEQENIAYSEILTALTLLKEEREAKLSLYNRGDNNVNK